jgi:hypothetical protein
VGQGIYRYYLDGTRFQVNGDGIVEVTVAKDAVTDSSGAKNRATTQKFTVDGTTARITAPSDGQPIGLASQNDRGFIDVTFGFPDGKTPNLDTIYDLEAEFDVVSAAGHSIRLDAKQAPVLLQQSANSYTFRYFTLGTYVSGALSVTLLPGTIAFTDRSASTSNDTLAVTAPETANVGYLDVRYQPITGYVLDADSVTDAEDEFTLGGAGANVTVSTALPAAAPHRQQHLPLLSVG